MSDRDVPFWVTVTAPAVEAVEEHLADLDLVPVAERPGMAMASLAERMGFETVVTHHHFEPAD